MRSGVVLAGAIVALVVVAGSSGETPGQGERSHWTSTPERLSLSAEERSALEKVAVDGSARAAQRLSVFYRTLPDGDHLREIEYWTRVEVENGGGPGAEYTLGLTLVARGKRNSDELDHRRGCYWLRRAAAAGIVGVDDEITETGCPTPLKTPEWVGFKGSEDK